MYVKNLRLKNFRKFKKGYVKFNPEFMAITGKNASGKTQILDAIAIILGTVQSKLIQSEEAVQHLCNEDAHICTDKNFQDNAQYPVRVTANLEYKDTAYRMRQTKTSAEDTTVEEWIDERVPVLVTETLPMMAYYGIGRVQPLEKSKDPLRKRYFRLSSYEDSLNPYLNLKEIREWLADQPYLELQNGTQVIPLLNKVLQKLIPTYDLLYWDTLRRDIFFRFRNPDGTLESCPYSNLSDGFRCMISMVMDMVRRITILNPHLKEDALAKTPGVVLIDELGLFLHPEWQQRIVEDLQSVFPKIQFIVTTQSPHVLNQLTACQVCILDRYGMEPCCVSYPEHSYGRDVEYILQSVMNTPYLRPKVIMDKLEKLGRDFNEDRFEIVKASIEELRNELGEDGELVRADIIMRFKESQRQKGLNHE